MVISISCISTFTARAFSIIAILSLVLSLCVVDCVGDGKPVALVLALTTARCPEDINNPMDRTITGFTATKERSTTDPKLNPKICCTIQS